MIPMRNLKTKVLNEKTLSLHLLETLIALSISAATNPAAQLAMEKFHIIRPRAVHTLPRLSASPHNVLRPEPPCFHLQQK